MAGRSKKSPDQDSDGRYRATTPDIVQLAAEIRTSFIQSRKNINEKACGVSKAMNEVFIKAAFICRETGESPEGFVQARLDEMTRTGVPIYPQALVSTKVNEHVQADAPKRADEILAYYLYQFDLFDQHIKVSPVHLVIQDQARPYSPLFRCYAAIKHELPAVVAHYRDDARRELASHPIATQLFGSVIETL